MRTEAKGKKTPVLFLIITIQHLIPQSCKRKPFLSVRFLPRIALYATLPISTSRQWFWDIVSPPMPNPESCIRAALLSNLPGGYGFPFLLDTSKNISRYSRYFKSKNWTIAWFLQFSWVPLLFLVYSPPTMAQFPVISPLLGFYTPNFFYIGCCKIPV